MGWADFFIGDSGGDQQSSLNNWQRGLQAGLISDANKVGPNGEPVYDFLSTYGVGNAGQLSSGQLTSLQALEEMSTNIAGQGPGGRLSGTEVAAGKTLEEIMGRSSSSPEFQSWFDASVTDPGKRVLERDDITRGRQFAGADTMFSSDRVDADALGRENFWNANASARGSAAIANENLRAQAAGIVPSLRTQSQADQEQADLLNALVTGQDLPRQITNQQIAMQLWNYENKQKQKDLWRKYQLGLLGIPSVAGYSQPTDGLVPGLIEAMASMGSAYLGKK